MNTKKILGIIAALMLVAVALVGAGAAAVTVDAGNTVTGSIITVKESGDVITLDGVAKVGYAASVTDTRFGETFPNKYSVVTLAGVLPTNDGKAVDIKLERYNIAYEYAMGDAHVSKVSDTEYKYDAGYNGIVCDGKLTIPLVAGYDVVEKIKVVDHAENTKVLLDKTFTFVNNLNFVDGTIVSAATIEGIVLGLDATSSTIEVVKEIVATGLDIPVGLEIEQAAHVATITIPEGKTLVVEDVEGIGVVAGKTVTIDATGAAKIALDVAKDGILIIDNKNVIIAEGKKVTVAGELEITDDGDLTVKGELDVTGKLTVDPLGNSLIIGSGAYVKVSGILDADENIRFLDGTGVLDATGATNVGEELLSMEEICGMIETDGVAKVVKVYGSDGVIYNVSIPATGTVTASVVNTTPTIFNYELLGNSSVLIPGAKYATVDGKNTFKVPTDFKTLDEYYLDDKVVEGLYYIDGNDKNAAVYVTMPAADFANVTETSVSVEDKEKTKIEIRVPAAFDGKVTPVVRYEGAGTYRTAFPSGIPVTFNADIGPFKEADTGVWTVYADFGATAGLLSKNTPDAYRYVEIKDFEIISEKSNKASKVELSATEVKDGKEFTVTVYGSTGSEIKVYYLDSSDNEQQITTAKKDFYLTPSQSYAWDPTNYYFNVDANDKKAVIGITANMNKINDKTYKLVIKDSKNLDDDNNPIDIEAEITVKAVQFTAAFDKTSYALGEKVKLLGTYDSKMDLFFYIEGSNKTFLKLDNNVVGYKFTQKADGENWEATFGGDNFKSWNTGTYTMYVSTLNEPATAGAGNYITDLARCAAIAAAGKDYTLVLTQPMITAEVVSEVEKNDFLKATVAVEGTDQFGVYIVGQNSAAAIYAAKLDKNGNQDMITVGDTGFAPFAGTPIYSIKDNDKDKYKYLFAEYPLKGVSETVANVLKYYGPATYKSYKATTETEGAAAVKDAIKVLIIKNDDGSFTVYKFVENMDYGQYYLVAQHPMADKVFNAWGKILAGGNDQGYTAGVNIYLNNAFKFNIPYLKNVDAAGELLAAIEAGHDKYQGAAFYVVPVADADELFSGVQSTYAQGDKIVITVKNSDKDAYLGTLEANEFEFDAANVNYKKTFAAEDAENGNKKDFTLTLDTTQVPAGAYQIILSDGKDVVKVYDVKITGGYAPVDPVEPVEPVEPVDPVDPVNPPAPATPGFGILAALAGLGAVAVLVLRRH